MIFECIVDIHFFVHCGDVLDLYFVEKYNYNKKSGVINHDI